jgi:hypothetical protein
MRRSMLIAAFLATTALTPTRADAGPALLFVGGLFGVGGAAGAIVGGTYAAGAAFAGTLWGGLLVRTVLSVGLSLLAAKLNQPTIPPPAARMVNFAQPVSYAEWVFGRTRKGGPIGFTGFLDNKRYYVPILASHSIAGIAAHWLDEGVVTLNSETDQTLSNIATGVNASGYGRINAFLGQSGQAVDAGLNTAFAEITTSHNFKGLSGAVIWCKRPPKNKFSTIYPRHRQWAYAPVIDGNDQIYDPRGATSTGYSNNAALVIAYWLVEVLGREVDWADVAIEADVCDELVTNAEAATQPRWTINGTISDDQDFEDQRAQLAGACDAFMYERADGKVGFKVGRWIEPTVTLTPADFLSFEITEGNWGAGAATEVACVYTEPENAWRETPSGTWIEDATARPIRDEPKLYMSTNHNQTARMNKRIARTKRARYQLRGTLNMIGYELLEQRFVRVVHPEMGIDAYFEIGELAREGAAVFSLTANSVTSEDFDFVAATEEPTRPVFDSVTNNDDIEDVAGLSATAVESGAVDFSWTAADESLTQQIRLRVDSDTDWQTYTVPEGDNQIRITGLIDTETYEYQALNRTAALRPGDWKPDTPDTIVVVANSTAPAVLDDFSGTLDGSDVDLDFTAPNDPNYFATRIYRATDSTDFSNASLIRTEYGIPSNADAWTDTAPGSGDQSYWAEPINASGVEGTKSGPETITIP